MTEFMKKQRLREIIVCKEEDRQMCTHRDAKQEAVLE
jgi:hypothetical protein